MPVSGSPELLRLLLRHVQRVDWAAALLQPAAEELPILLPLMVDSLDEDQVCAELAGEVNLIITIV